MTAQTQLFIDKYGIRVETPDWEQGKPLVFKNLGNYAEAMVKGRPSSVTLLVTLPRQTPDLLHVAFFGYDYEAQNSHSQVLTPSNPYKAVVPIYDWDENGRPQIRQEPFDNFRILVIERKTGRFTLLEIGLVWRKQPEGFYRTSQVLYEGQVTRFGTRQGVHMLPADGKSARPGLDFGRQWQEIDAAIPGIVRQHGVIVPTDVKAATWNPGPPPTKEGDWIIVNFNSWVAEQGGAMDEEGVKTYLETGDIPDTSHFLFLHGSVIEGNDPIRVVPLARWVKAKVGEKKNPRHRFRPITWCESI